MPALSLSLSHLLVAVIYNLPPKSVLIRPLSVSTRVMWYAAHLAFPIGPRDGLIVLNTRNVQKEEDMLYTKLMR